ncbi:MAG TPA: hypothetical protein V6D02_11260 [Candidatus Obscuribacterales bacterium]
MLKPRFLTLAAIATATPMLLWACSSEPVPPAATDEPAADEVAATGDGQLALRANGEDFVRQGFVTKDGWQINFDHLYVSLAEITAYQSDPPFDAEAGGTPEAKQVVELDAPVTIDLAAGDADAEPILIDTVAAPAGRYNALSWKMVPATTGPAAGQTIWIEGTAAKAGQTVDFTLKLDPELGFVCGDFVGDSRKGILEASSQADLEATFHFDHLFGDGEAPPDDDINTGALGFDPLAAIATDGTLDIDMAGLEAQLAPAEYELLLSILPSLGHVGEGHCDETELTGS